MSRDDVLKVQLTELNKTHSDLDRMISRMLEERIVNQIAVQRLKKQKLLVRDQITKIYSQLLPNIIA